MDSVKWWGPVIFVVVSRGVVIVFTFWKDGGHPKFG